MAPRSSTRPPPNPLFVLEQYLAFFRTEGLDRRRFAPTVRYLGNCPTSLVLFCPSKGQHVPTPSARSHEPNRGLGCPPCRPFLRSTVPFPNWAPPQALVCYGNPPVVVHQFLLVPGRSSAPPRFPLFPGGVVDFFPPTVSCLPFPLTTGRGPPTFVTFSFPFEGRFLIDAFFFSSSRECLGFREGLNPR